MRPHRILVIAEGQLGDLLLLTPALRALKSTFPSCHVALLVLQRRVYGAPHPAPASIIVENPEEGTCAAVLENHCVDEVLEIDREALRSKHGVDRIRQELGIVRNLRKRNFDTVICTFPQDRFVLWALASGARIRSGQRRQTFSRFLTNAPDIDKEEVGVLMYYARLAEAVGARIGSLATEYRVPPGAQEWAASVLQTNGLSPGHQLVAVHPGKSGRFGIWPPDRFARLIDMLQADGRTKVLLCGANHDAATLAAVKELLHSAVVEVFSGGSVSRLGAILQRCEVCVSNDSGPRHLAVAVGTPTVAIMGRFKEKAWQVYRDDPRHWTLQGSETCPACPPGVCHDVVPAGEAFGSFCIRMVTVEDVVLKVRELLARTFPPSGSENRTRDA